MELDLKKKVTIGIFIIIVLIISIYLYYDYSKSDDTINLNQETTNEENIEDNTFEDEETDESSTIIIHIAGAVNNPGIVKMEEGTRLYEAIDKAGGSLEKADLSKINLAYELSDGQKIYIPKIGEEIDNTNESIEYVSSDFGNNELIEEDNEESGGEKVNINTASQTELETLPGIGPSTAQKIIDYRNKSGKFKSIEDVQNVKGIGDAKYGEIKDSICV